MEEIEYVNEAGRPHVLLAFEASPVEFPACIACTRQNLSEPPARANGVGWSCLILRITANATESCFICCARDVCYGKSQTATTLETTLLEQTTKETRSE